MKSKILEYQRYILSLAVVLVITGLVAFSANYYKHYRIDKLKKMDAQIKQEAEKERLLTDELENLKKEFEILRNRKPQTIVRNITSEINHNSGTTDLATVIKEQTPRIAEITCKYVPLPGMGAALSKWGISPEPQYGSGSGFLDQIYDEKLQRTMTIIITNWHVLSGHNGFSPAETCKIKIGSYSYEVSGLDIGIRGISNADDSDKSEVKFIDDIPYKIWDPDAGYLIIENPSLEIQKLSTKPDECSQKPPIGEEVVILGFPAIGATQSITATNGIISGTDPRYYVTSAKIEEGNSGGAAFWIKENCYIGIPTFSITGKIESLARILDIGYLFKK